MAAIFVCGAECSGIVATAGHWDSVVGTGLTLETTTIEPGGDANSYKWVANAAQACLSHTIAQKTLADRFYFRFDTLPNADATIARYDSATGTTAHGYVTVTSGGQIKIKVGSGSYVNVGSAVTTGGWHYLDVKVDATGTTSYIYARLDGGTEASASYAVASANLIAIKRGWAGAPTTGTIYIDQGYTADMADYPIGPSVAIAGYRPTSDGTHTATGTHIVKGTTAVPTGTAITSATTDAYQWVDDATISSTGDFWNQQTVATEYVEVGFGTISVVPKAVEVLIASCLSS